jgi:hypothetical protein
MGTFEIDSQTETSGQVRAGALALAELLMCGICRMLRWREAPQFLDGPVRRTLRFAQPDATA